MPGHMPEAHLDVAPIQHFSTIELLQQVDARRSLATSTRVVNAARFSFSDDVSKRSTFLCWTGGESLTVYEIAIGIEGIVGCSGWAIASGALCLIDQGVAAGIVNDP